MFSVVKKNLAEIKVKVTLTKNTDTQEVWCGSQTMVGTITEADQPQYVGTTIVLQFAKDDPIMNQLKQGFAEAFAAALADGDTRPFVSVSGLVIPPAKPAMGKNPATGMMTNNVLVAVSTCQWNSPEIFVDEAPLGLVSFEEAAETTLHNAREAVMANKESRYAALLEQHSVEAANAAIQGAQTKAAKKKAK